MSNFRRVRRVFWLLPIVVALGVVMVLPGGTLEASASSPGNALAASEGIVGPGGGSSTNPLHLPDTGAFPSPSPSPTSSATSALDSIPFAADATATSGSPTSSNNPLSLPPYLAEVPWAEALDHPTRSIAPTTSLPNLDILRHPLTSVDGQITPGVTSQPAPLGITDYGLGTQTYAYNTSHIAGSVTFNTPPNASQPGGADVVLPSLGAQHQGYTGSVYEFGIQLNTIGSNLTIPGTDDQGYVWAQNVVNWNDTAVHFVQDTWNFSLDSDSYLQQDSIFSACDNDTAGANYILDVYGGVLQCVDGSIPIGPADFPITLTLYNNFSTNAQERSQLSYGYSLFEAGTGTFLSGDLDDVVFNNTAPSWQNPAPPANAPGNVVDGFAPTPTYGPDLGFAQDAEIDLVGGIGGDNAVFQSVNGSMSLQYSNDSVGGWQNVPSAYNFGTDTGETGTGIADYWTPSHTLEINQGPTMLYGLWNAEPQVSVAAGDIQLAGSVDPSYGFLFVSNTPPVDNPFAPGAAPDNMSWLPTNSTGGFNTYLPPLGGAWTSRYYLQAFASGSREFNGTLLGTNMSVAIHLAPAPGLLRAPLYMATAAQASALSAATGGSTSAPYSFRDLQVGINASFNHLNDYDYPSFVLFQSEGTGYGVDVDHIFQGTDNGTSATDNSYLLDYPLTGATGLLVPGPSVVSDLANFTAEVDIWDGVGDRVTDQTLFDVGGQGSQLVLWRDLDAIVDDTTSLGESSGVWIGDSTGTFVGNTTAASAIGVTDVGSTGTTVWNEAVDDGLGVEALGTFDSVYSWINVTALGEGVETGADFGPATTFYYDFPGSTGLVVTDLNVTLGGEAANITFSVDTTFDAVSLFATGSTEELGIALDGDAVTTIHGLAANDAPGLDVWNATDTTVNGWLQENYDTYYGAVIQDSNDTDVIDLNVADELAGPIFFDDVNTTISDALVGNVYVGVELEYQDGVTGVGLESDGATFGYELDYATGPVSITDVDANDASVGLNVDYTVGAIVNDVHVNATQYLDSDSAGVDFLDSTGGSISDVTATNDSIGVRLSQLDTGANGNTVTNVLAVSGSIGVQVDGSRTNSIAAVDAVSDSTGVLFDDSASDNAVTTVVVQAGSTGVEFEDDQGNSASGISATGGSIGALLLSATAGNDVSGVTATDGSTGVEFSGATGDSANAVVASDGSVGILSDPSTGISVSDVSATDGATAVVFEGTTDSSATDISATNGSVGVGISPEVGPTTYYSSNIAVSAVTVSNLSIGVVATESGEIDISGVTATNVTLSSPWTTGDFAFRGIPISAVVTEEDYQVQISNLVATNYPIALYDDDSGTGLFGLGSVYAQGVNSTNGEYAVELNFTVDGLFRGISATGDLVGALLFEAEENEIVASTFTDCASYGVWIGYAGGNAIWDNSFVGNNGATPAYSAAHVQAFSGSDNLFDSPNAPYTGNYWSDWHSWNPDGTLSPYYLGDQNWDYQPLAVPADEAAVWFFEDGLAGGTPWSVTLNGVTETGADVWMVFGVPAGTYTYSVAGIAGYTVTPAAGVLTTGLSGTTEIDLAYAATTTVVLTESGLAAGTSWTATFDGVTESATSSAISFATVPGTYSYQVASLAGYSVSPSSGTVTVGGSTYELLVTFVPLSSATSVTFTESGLPAGTNWSATFNGVTESSTSPTITFSTVTGTYDYQVSPVAGYTVAPSIGTVTVGAPTYNLVVTFTQVTYAVTVSSTGLPAGTSWTATVNGVTQSTTGSSLVWYLPNGTYSYSVSAPSGYRLIGGGSEITVNGGPGAIDATFSSTSVATYVLSSTFLTWVIVALVLAVLALGIAVAAYARRGREDAEPPAEWAGPVSPSGPVAETPTAGGEPATEPAPAMRAAEAPTAGGEPVEALPPAPAAHDEWDEEPANPP
jgi:hypothetical protein